MKYNLLYIIAEIYLMNQVWYNNFHFIFKLCITVPTLGELGYNISIVHVDQSVLSDAVSHSSEIRFLCLMKWSC